MGLLGFNFYVLENVSLADLWLGIFIVISAINGVGPRKSDIRFFILFFTIFSVFGALAYKLPHFEVIYWANNSIRALYYSIAMVMCSAVARSRSDKIFQILRLNAYIVFGSVLIELSLQPVGIYYSYFVNGITTDALPHSDFFRPSSFFNEPSFLAIFSAVNYYLLQRTKPERYGIRIITLTTMFLSLSFSGYVMAAYFIATDSNLWGRYRKGRTVTLLLLLSCILVVGVEQVFPRLTDIRLGEDGSFTHRIMGSWELLLYLLRDYVFTGIGLGQFKSWLVNLDQELIYHWYSVRLNTGSGINNVFVMMLGWTGIFGLLAFLYFVVSVSRERNFLILNIWVFMAWGLVLHPLIAFFYGVVYGLEANRKKNFNPLQ